MEVILIAAKDKNNVIGKDNNLPWKISEDMKYFREQTTGHAVIMGHNTYKSIGKPLKNRLNIVLSFEEIEIPETHTFTDFKSAIEFAKSKNQEKCFIIGGATVYKYALDNNLLSKMLLTEIDEEFEGNVYFPDYDDISWKIVDERVFHDDKADVNGSFVTYINKKHKSYVDPENAGTEDYHGVLNDIVETGVCPFCIENFKWHREPILKETENWLITTNSWPYENTKYHFLLNCKQHKEQLSELTQQDFSDVMELINWVCKEYEIMGGGLAIRFGDTRYTGASVVHLHFHLIVPIEGENNRAIPVWFPIG